MGFFPRNDKFFDLLAEFAASIRRGADLYVRLFDDFANREAYAAQIREVERECDRHSAAIMEWLHASFITPLDREDIFTLATEMDDIMDMIHKIARLTLLYDVQASSPPAAALARLLQEAVAELEKACVSLRNRQDVHGHIDRIRGFEDQGDVIAKEAIQSVLANEKNPVEIIKWLKVYEQMERGLNRCKRVAKVLAGIVLKNS